MCGDRILPHEVVVAQHKVLLSCLAFAESKNKEEFYLHQVNNFFYFPKQRKTQQVFSTGVRVCFDYEQTCIIKSLN